MGASQRLRHSASAARLRSLAWVVAASLGCVQTGPRLPADSGPTRCTPSGWILETIDVSGDVGQSTSLAIDRDDNLHVAYYDATNGDLKYASRRPGETFERSTIDSTNDVGEYVSIAVDPALTVHFAYRDHTAYQLMYASRRTGGAVDTLTADPSFHVGGHTSIAVDRAQTVHIAYQDNYNFDLKYARRSTGSDFASIALDASPEMTGLYAKLALDPNTNEAFVVHFDGTLGDLELGHVGKGDAGNEVIDSSGVVGEFCSISIDSRSGLHVAYYDRTRGVLKHAVRALGTAWQVKVVDSSANVGGYTAMALDPDERVHIVYHDFSNADLKHAAELEDAGFLVEVVDSPGAVGLFNSAAIDGAGNMYVSYYDATNGDLRLASRCLSQNWK